MPNLAGILGTMMATGMAGHGSRGRSQSGGGMLGGFGGGLLGGALMGGGGGLGKKAGLAAMGYLAYKAYQDYQRNQASRPQTAPARDSAWDGSLADRLGRGMGASPPQEMEAQFSDQKALLLIRAMIAAAAADGTISADERSRILDHLAQAGASEDDRRFVEGELDRPCSMDTLLSDVADEETAEQVLLASTMAIDVDTPAERRYLDYLASRLNIDEQRVQAITGRA